MTRELFSVPLALQRGDDAVLAIMAASGEAGRRALQKGDLLTAELALATIDATMRHLSKGGRASVGVLADRIGLAAKIGKVGQPVPAEETARARRLFGDTIKGNGE